MPPELRHKSKLEKNEVNLKALREKREAYANTARNILTHAEAEGRALTAEETRDFDGLKAKIAALSETLDRAAQLAEFRAQIEKPIVSGPIVPASGEGMVFVPRDVRPGEVRVYRPNEAMSEGPYVGPGLGAYIRGLCTGKWGGAEELRDLGAGSTPGSYLVPTPLSLRVIDLIRNQARVLQAGALVVPMDSSTLKIARQTGDVTAGWKSENSAITFSDANFDVVTFTARTLTAGTKISIEAVEDCIGIDAILMNSIVKALGLELDRVCLYGTGTPPQPKGIKGATGVTVTDLATDGYTLVDFSKYSTAISTLMGYNFNGPFSILHSARTAGKLDNLQDTLHQPLRQPDLVAAARKLVTNQIPNNLSHGASNAASDAFVGAFENCMVGMRTALALEITRVAADSNGSAFSNMQVWIRAYLRADCQIAHPLAFNVLTGIL